MVVDLALLCAIGQHQQYSADKNSSVIIANYVKLFYNTLKYI